MDRNHPGSAQKSKKSFSNVLQEMKCSGCNLLLTGDVSNEVRMLATKKLFGDEAYNRTRILVCTMPAQQRNTHLESLLSTEYDQIVFINQGCNPLQSLNDRICTTIKDVEEIGDLTPAQLRIGFNSLGPLLTEYEPQNLLRFFESFSNVLDRTGGIAHFHLSKFENITPNQEILSYFDAQIQLDYHGGTGPVHRWDVPDIGYCSPWIPL